MARQDVSPDELHALPGLIRDDFGRGAFVACGWIYRIAPGRLTVSCIAGPVERWADPDWVAAQFEAKARPPAAFRRRFAHTRAGGQECREAFQRAIWQDWRRFGRGLIAMAEDVAQLGP